jgi:hypothetical protein
MAVNNTLASVIPTLYAQGLSALRSASIMPRLVLNDYSDEVKKKGEVIQVPLPSVMTTTAVVPGAFAPDPQNVAPTTAPIALDFWEEAAFTLTEKELAQIVAGVPPMQMTAAVQAMAFRINQTIMNLAVNVPNITGTPGTTPFAADVTAATNAGAILTNQFAPFTDRHIVLNPTAYGTALALPTFYGALYNGGTEMVGQGVIANKFGFNWHQDQQIPTHVSGSITGILAAQASTSQPVGTTAVIATTAASTGAVALLTGDIITFSGDSTQYVLTGNATQATAASNVTLNIFPAKAVALAGGETITVKATHVTNLAFHQQAFAFASRPLTNDNLSQDPDLTMMVPDPVSGLTMRMIIREEFHRTRVAYDVLWGAAPVRPLLPCRIAG